MAILRALRGGQMTGGQIAAAVAAEHGLDANDARRRVYWRLGPLEAQGAIVACGKAERGRRVWGVLHR
jgi:hypothetical protein